MQAIEVHGAVTGGAFAAARAVSSAAGEAGSALGLGQRRVVPLDPCERTTLAATNHFALLRSRRVAEALAGWLR